MRAVLCGKSWKGGIALGIRRHQ